MPHLNHCTLRTNFRFIVFSAGRPVPGDFPVEKRTDFDAALYSSGASIPLRLLLCQIERRYQEGGAKHLAGTEKTGRRVGGFSQK